MFKINNSDLSQKPESGPGLIPETGRDGASIFEKPVFWIILVILLVAVGASSGYLLLSGPQVTENIQTNALPLPTDYHFKALESDQYPADFPEKLIVENGEWRRAEDTTTSNKARLRIVELSYNTDPASLAALFRANFEKDGWKKTADIKKELTLVVEAFLKNSEIAILTIRSVGEKSLANITLKTQKLSR